MSIDISKKDIIWSYFSHFFSIASGMITLPIILRMLSADEIGMNYLMLTVASLVSLFDFGFTPQFSRNITYVFSGAQELKKEGVNEVATGNGVNYHLLAIMINTAKFIYRRLAIIVWIIMITFGSSYIFKVTNGFTNVNNSLIIWILFSISTFFNIYYSYYTSLLTGKGLIMESKKAMVYSKSIYIILTYIFLYFGMGLLGVAISSLISPFVNRFISYKYFFTSEMKIKVNVYSITKEEKFKLFNIIWYNAKKLGLTFVGGYAITRLSMFLAGLYLSLSQIASYGLMMQFVGLIAVISCTLIVVIEPRFSALRIQGSKNTILKLFAFTMNVYYIIYIFGITCLIVLGPWLLKLIGSKSELPPFWVLFTYALVILLEGNHSNFATLIVTKNNIPFVGSALIVGACIAIGSFLSLAFTSYGLLGLILVQGISQLAYSNWKWPYEVCKEFNVTFPNFLLIGFKESLNQFNKHFHGK